MGSCWSSQVVIVNGKVGVFIEVSAWASRCCLLTWVSPSGCWIQLCGGGYLGQFLVSWKRGKKDTWIRVNPSNSPHDNLFCIGLFTHMYTQQQDLIFSAAEGLLYWDTTSFLFTFSPYLCSLPKKQWEGPTKCKTKTVKVWLLLHLPWNNKSLSLIQLSETSNGFLCHCLRELAFK